MMAAINIGAPLEYGRPQGVLRRANILGQLDRDPAAAATATKVKLARKAHMDEKMEVDGDERRRSSNMEALNAQGHSTDAMVSQEPPFAFKMAEELTFSILAYSLRSTRDGPNSYGRRVSGRKKLAKPVRKRNAERWGGGGSTGRVTR